MIHPDSNVKWIDAQSETQGEGNIGDLVSRYISKGTNVGDIISIDFDAWGKNIYIQDFQGYARIKSIWRHNSTNDVKWLKISAEGHVIIATDNTFFPVYKEDGHVLKHGLNGAIRRLHTLKHAGKIDPTIDCLRIYDESEKVDTLAHPVIEILDPSEVPSYGYEIFTAMRFYGVEGIYMFGSNEIKVDEFEDYHLKSCQVTSPILK